MGRRMRLGVMLLDSPYRTEDVDTAIHFIESALARGHEIVGVFLFTDGLYTLNRRISSPGDRNLAKELEALASRVHIVGCGTCAKFRGIGRADLIEGAALSGLTDLLEMLDACDRFVTFGG
jgi:sulfur relay protein TusD/DsrE